LYYLSTKEPGLLRSARNDEDTGLGSWPAWYGIENKEPVRVRQAGFVFLFSSDYFVVSDYINKGFVARREA
jgi:hypothetical protein